MCIICVLTSRTYLIITADKQLILVFVFMVHVSVPIVSAESEMLKGFHCPSNLTQNESNEPA